MHPDEAAQTGIQDPRLRASQATPAANHTPDAAAAFIRLHALLAAPCIRCGRDAAGILADAPLEVGR